MADLNEGWNWKEISVIREALMTAIRMESRAIASLQIEIGIRRLMKSIPKSLVDMLAHKKATRSIMIGHLIDVRGRAKGGEEAKGNMLLGKAMGIPMGLIFGWMPLRLLYACHEGLETISANYFRRAAEEFERKGILVLRPELGEAVENAETEDFEHAHHFRRIRTGRASDAYFQTLN